MTSKESSTPSAPRSAEQRQKVEPALRPAPPRLSHQDYSSWPWTSSSDNAGRMKPRRPSASSLIPAVKYRRSAAKDSHSPSQESAASKLNPHPRAWDHAVGNQVPLAISPVGDRGRGRL